MKQYDEMIRDVHSRIEQHEREQKQRKGRIMKCAAAVTPVIALGAVGFGVLQNRSETAMTAPVNRMESVQVETETTVSDIQQAKFAQTTAVTAELSVKSNISETTIFLSGDIIAEMPQNGTELPADTAPRNGVTDFAVPDSSAHTAAQTVTEPIRETQPITAKTIQTIEPFSSEKQDTMTQPVGGNGNGFCLIGDEEPPEYLTLITSYPSSVECSYSAPHDGEFGFTMPLSDAMAEYGDSANYLVIVDLFSDGHQIWDRAAFEAESQRLFQLGYTPIIETFSSPEGSSVALQLNATYEQLKNFPASPDHGYFFVLRDERN